MPSSEAPPRPAHADCTCVWPRAHARHAAQLASDELRESRVESVTDPLRQSVPFVPDIAKRALGLGETKPEIDRQATVYSTPGVVRTTAGARDDDAAERGLVRDRLHAKQRAAKSSLAGAQHNDVLVRRIKKILSKSMENKLRDLVSYREDLVTCLKALLPDFDQSDNRKHASVTDPSGVLCDACRSVLVHHLLHSPARFAAYLREHSTRAYLSLIDDAIISSSLSVQIEGLTHNELDRTLRGELAVVEWRLVLKLSRFHKKTDLLSLFPVNIGSYAEVTPARDLPKQPEGWLKRGGRKALNTVGLGSTGTAPPDPPTGSS